MKRQSKRSAVLADLRHKMTTVEVEPTELWITPVEPLPTAPARPVPPPGGWPDDAGWTETADEHFERAGEEPQA